MKLQVIKIRVLSWIKKILLYGIYFFLFIMVVGFILLQFPAVQTSLANRITSNFSKLSGFEITYDQIYLTWYDRLEITGLLIKDPANNKMIEIEKVQVNFSLSTLLQDKNINLDAASLDKGSVNLIKISDSDSTRDFNINLFIAEINKLSSGSGKGTPPKVNIGEIGVYNTTFTLNDPQKDSIPNAFDYNHITLHLDEVNAQHFNIIGDTIQFKMNTFIAEEKNCNLSIQNISTYFRVSQTTMEFIGLNASIGESKISDTLIFTYKRLADLNDFNNKVTLKASLKKAILYPQDLVLFTPGAKPLPQAIMVSGNISGRISRFRLQDMEVAIGATNIKGSLQLDGLPFINETFINLNVKEGDIAIQDFAFLFPKNVFEKIAALGKFKLVGKFTGFIDDFVANGDFRGAFGKIKSDINLKIDQNHINESTFSGNLNLTDFNLGILLQDTALFQTVTLNGRIKGKGLTKETASFSLVGKIIEIGIGKYNYSDITTDARFAKELFSGEITINDPNLKLNAQGSIDIRKGQELISIKARLDTLFTDRIKLTTEPLFIKSFIEVESQGLQLDSLFGEMKMTNAQIIYRNQNLEIDSISIKSFLNEDNRNLQLRSSFADVDLMGNFFFSSLFQDINRLAQEFQLNIRNNTYELTDYYKRKVKDGRDYRVDFLLNLHDINPVLALAKLDMSVADKTVITGNFSNGFTSLLQAYAQIDTVIYHGKIFIDNEIEFSGSKIRDSTSVLAALSINSKRQELTKTVITKNLFAEAIWNKNHIDLNLDADQEGASNYARIQSEIDFLTDSIRIKILPTLFYLLDKKWQISQQNYILQKNSGWEIKNLKLFNADESLLLDGFISEDPEKSLILSLTNLNLSILNSISTSKFGGVVNGKIEMKDVYKEIFIQNNVTIKDLTVDRFLVGDVIGTNEWNREKDRFDINFLIDRASKRTLTLKGYYDPREKSPLYIHAKLEATNIKLIEPFLKGIFSQMNGELSGEYEITGTFSQPLIEGEGKIEGGQIMIDYLKTLYTFQGTLGITPNKIIFKDFNLQDGQRNGGYLDGYLTHRNFSKFRIVLDANFTNFQVLNTTSKDNSLFYGQAYGTGKLNMFGPLSNMKISATARTSKNTRIYIPISGSSSVEKSEFITFVNFTDTIRNTVAEKKKNYNTQSDEPTGIVLDLNLDITPDAYTEIIFDIKAGDIIRGYGNGDISLKIDTKGEFNMFGLYEFEQGNYNFTLYNILNKEFNITKGSRISWSGDPYAGILNLTASYRQMASLSPILPNQSEDIISTPQARRKYPVEVLLKLNGAMLSPQISFDIDAKNLPDNITTDNGGTIQPNFAFNAFKAKLDDQELERQVFSLIILRRFSPPDAFSTSGSLSNSVSELLSNQLSYWLTQVDQNLEIDIDLGSLDQEAFNTFQLRLSYSFLNGRLRVTRDGSFNNQYNSGSEVASLIGDWTVDYVLTSDGKFKVKMYSRSNFNQINSSVGTQTAVTTGVSLLHTQNFNQLKELISSSRDKRRKQILEDPINEEAVIENEERNK
ncbi:MAG: translocation/assembly module TamB [Cyclobacteriaceae bacterium]|nr:translocation/assembly module TamB [Cyclobacteriaceae bacterium]